MERIPSLFDPLPLVSEPAVLANPGNALPITVRTAAEQWAYALRLQRAEPRTDLFRAVLIRVTASVNSGTINDQLSAPRRRQASKHVCQLLAIVDLLHNGKQLRVLVGGKSR